MPDRCGCNVCAVGRRQQGQPCSDVLGACDRTQNLICQYPDDPNILNGVCEYGKKIKSYIQTSAQKKKFSVNLQKSCKKLLKTANSFTFTEEILNENLLFYALYRNVSSFS